MKNNSKLHQYINKNFLRTSSFISGFALAISDCLMIMLAICTSFFIINFIDREWITFKSFYTYGIYLPPMIAVFYAAGLYPGFVLPPEDEVKKFSICTLFIFIGIALSIAVEEVDDKWAIVAALILATPFAALFLTMGREFSRWQFGRMRWYGVPAVIYMTNGSGNFIIDRLLKKPEFGYKPAIIIDSKAETQYDYKGIPVLPPSDVVFSEIKAEGIKVAIICSYDQDTTDINSYYRYTIQIPKIQDTNTISMNVRDFGGILGFASTHNLTKGFSLLLKRLNDLLMLLLASPFLVPLVLIVSIIVKLTSKGPIFYGHKRVGKNGKEFKCWKFRSMVIDADKQLEKILAEHPEMRAEWERDRKFTNDPRVTKIGKFLRKTSIDEIPQFFNVLTGEMSFIGPRPVTEPELVKYGNKRDFILSVQPGLSGMWQISGRSDTGYEERITLDSYYIQNWSIWLDFWIIIKTIYVVLKGKGAY